MLTSYTVESSPHILPAANLNISNFPNPFNPSTTICFDLELSSQVNINIYNAKGQMIDTLFQGGMEAGKQYLYWDSATYSPNLPSGNYYFNIKTAHHQDVHKVMLLK
jgi:flagellar hook assembly protein FlgD